MTPELIRALTPCMGIVAGTIILSVALCTGASGERLTIASAIATASISGGVGLAQRGKDKDDD
ncbi:MAG: hypothetical protein KME46_33790 [Brasilonema angustatum HA4187-MV1]|nr:hypothetical protein [Brasilonema angustatum HA4187-MV1]